MKKIILIAVIAFTALNSNKTFAQQGFGTNTPNKSSAVDIVSTKRGLLIPRIDLVSTTNAQPVSNPAQSLLVYNKNTAGDVTPGFYYWEDGKWVRVISSNINKTSSVINGTTTNVSSLISTDNPNNTEYVVEVNEAALKLQNIGGSLISTQIASGSDKQVLVTKLNSEGDLETVWVNANEIISNGIEVGDGLTKTGNEIKLGGQINGTVVLDLENNGSIKITDLPTLPNRGTGAFNTNADKIMVLNPDGTLKQANVIDILDNAINSGTITGKDLSAGDDSVTVTDGKGATLINTNVKVSDGGISTVKLATNAVTTEKLGANAVTTEKLAANAVTNDILANNSVTTEKIVDGTILAADIKSEGNSKVLVTNANGDVSWIDQSNLGNTVTANNGLTKTENNIKLGGTLTEATTIETAQDKTLAITGLNKVDADNELMVVESNGVIRKVIRSISTTTSTDLSVVSIADYSPYVQEINISAEANNSDFTIHLPAAAKGQTINIKLTNTAEVNGYVSVKFGGTELTYGSLPYQGWIIKSNGTNWSIVGRN